MKIPRVKSNFNSKLKKHARGKRTGIKGDTITMASRRACKFGDKCKKIPLCKFWHRSDDIISSEGSQSELCKYGQVACRYGGACSKRPKCPFDHSSSEKLQGIKDEYKCLLEEHVPKVRENHSARIDDLKTELAECTRKDEIEVKRALLQEYKSQLETFDSEINTIEDTLFASTDNANQHRLDTLKREMRRLESHLPIYARRKELMNAVRKNRVLVLRADTGSGKSTQLVQYLLDAGFANERQIVCSQPRRLAARALANRVAEECGCQVGEAIGYLVGADSPCLSSSTKVRFVTDSVLLNEYKKDPKLSRYSVVIIDEAHERRVDTDLLFGVMKLCLRDRSDIKLIVMSATLDANLFLQYYQDSVLIEVPGRTYPIEDEYASEDPENYLAAAISKVHEIHKDNNPGDILVFLTAPDEIDRAVDEVQRCLKEAAIVLPLHGKLNQDDTKRIFEPTPFGKRKIIFSTNVAETSVTIDGIRHVIESGMVKESTWDEKRKMQVLKIGNITQSSVKQRRGRAGRTSSGKCYHLYTKETFESFDVCPRAEILCIQPSLAVLKLKYLGVADDIEKFEWLETPSSENIREAIKCLKFLNAIDIHSNQLTKIGKHMAELDLPPMMSAMILHAKDEPHYGHILALAGMLNIAQTVWWRGKDDEARQLLDEKRAYFSHESDCGGDHIQLLKVFLEWNVVEKSKRTEWCRKNMINGKSMNMALGFITETAKKLRIRVPKFTDTVLDQTMIDSILKSVSAGYFQQLGISNGPLRSGYQLAASNNSNAQVHRTSTLKFSTQPPRYVFYHELTNLNGVNYMTTMCPADLEAIPSTWLNSLPQQPDDRIYISHTFSNIGPTLLFACLGKKCAKKQQLEDTFQAVLDVDYTLGTLTVWCHPNRLANAKQGIEELLRVEREKLINEVEEYEITGSTRILVGAGCFPLMVLLDNEYVKVIVRGLPTSVTEKEIEEKFRQYGEIRCVNLIKNGSDGVSASVIYHKCAHARDSVVRMSEKLWNNRRITVGPANTCKTVHTSMQGCKLRVQWFLAESECKGKVYFTKREAAEQAIGVLETAFNCKCQLKMNTYKPTVKCYWPVVQHTGTAIIDFDTTYEADRFVQCKTIENMRIQSSTKNNWSIFVRNIPRDYDEEDMKERFPTCTKVNILRGGKGVQLEKPPDVEYYIRDLLSKYVSFQKESVKTNEKLISGRVEAFVHFDDETDAHTAIAQLNGCSNIIGAGKLRMSLTTPKVTKKGARRGDEYIVEISQLPSTLIEDDLLNELRQHAVEDNISSIVIFRKKLAGETNEKRDMQADLHTLSALFNSRTHFRSQPEITINPTTIDGRVTAYVLYNNPDDVAKAIELHKRSTSPALFNVGQQKLHLAPLNDCSIVFNASLTNAIEHKINTTLEKVRTMSLLHVTVRKKEIGTNDQKIIKIYIQGTDNLELARIRQQFVHLMNGLEYRLNQPSWVNAVFCNAGKKFLKSLQKRTKTYILWNWSANFLRIFGEDNACNQVYKEIDRYIQNTIATSNHSISIAIPQECLRQCLRRANEFKSLGDDHASVTLNVARRLICMQGELTAAKQCENRVRTLLASLPKSSTKNAANLECPLCMGDCETPYTLQQCGHTYCRACLNEFFLSQCNSTLSLDAFEIRCLFDGCNVSCLLRDIKSILGAQKMEQLAKVAFQIYLKKPNNDLAQCIGNDCVQVYRPSQNQMKYTCDQCIKTYCVSCQVEFHDGISCEQYKTLLDKDNEERLLIENLGTLPYKKCPKCNILIEKYAGCNAVICTKCSIAFCWLCNFTHPIDAHAHFNDPSTPCYGKTFTSN